MDDPGNHTVSPRLARYEDDRERCSASLASFIPSFILSLFVVDYKPSLVSKDIEYWHLVISIMMIIGCMINTGVTSNADV